MTRIIHSSIKTTNNFLFIDARIADDTNKEHDITIALEPLITNKILSYFSKKYHEKALAIKKANAALDDLDE